MKITCHAPTLLQVKPVDAIALVVLLKVNPRVPLVGRNTRRKALKSLVVGRSSDSPDFSAIFLKPNEIYTILSQILQNFFPQLREQKPSNFIARFKLKRG